MTQQLTTHDGQTAVVEATDGLVRLTQSGGGLPHQTFDLDPENALEISATFTVRGRDFDSRVPLGGPLLEADFHHLRCAAECRQLASILKQAADMAS